MDNINLRKYNFRSSAKLSSESGSIFLSQLRNSKVGGNIVEDVLFQLNGKINTQLKIEAFAKTNSLASPYRLHKEFKWLRKFKKNKENVRNVEKKIRTESV